MTTTPQRRDRRAVTVRIPVDGRLPTSATIASTVRAVDGSITDLRRRWPALLRAVSDWGRGFPASSTVATSMGGATHGAAGDPVGRAAEQAVDHGQHDAAAALHDELLLAEGLMASLISSCSRILRIAPAASPEPSLVETATAPGAGTCGACERWCPGGPDRLRGGWCDACRKAWERHLARVEALVRDVEVAQAGVAALEAAAGDVVPIDLARVRREYDKAAAALAAANVLADRHRFAVWRRSRASGE